MAAKNVMESCIENPFLTEQPPVLIDMDLRGPAVVQLRMDGGGGQGSAPDLGERAIRTANERRRAGMRPPV